MLESLITLDEIERDRSPSEFVDWFERFLEKTRGDRSARSEILLRQGIAKPVYEEVFPLYRLLSHKRQAWPDRRFRNVLGNQPYDVIVTPASGRYAFIEITTADMDHAEAVRMEVFAVRGRVPAIAPVTWSGTKATGRRIEISEDMQLHSDLVEKKKKQIIVAIERKCQRSLAAANTALLAYFDDYVSFADAEDLPVMRELLATVRPIWTVRFRALYVVGASGRVWEEEL